MSHLRPSLLIAGAIALTPISDTAHAQGFSCWSNSMGEDATDIKIYFSRVSLDTSR